MRISEGGLLSFRKILKRVGPVAYEIALPPNLANLH
ncbi:hypothetical protein L195_g063109, partial [Trifolium pratense]